MVLSPADALVYDAHEPGLFERVEGDGGRRALLKLSEQTGLVPLERVHEEVVQLKMML